MFCVCLDDRPWEPGWGKIYQGGRPDAALWQLPHPTVIVNMDHETNDVVWMTWAKGNPIVGILHIGIHDLPSHTLPDPVLLGYLDTGVSLLKRGVNLFVHCAAGISRSSYITIGLYMRLGLSFTNARRQVEKNHPGVYPNEGFESQLRRLENRIRANE